MMVIYAYAKLSSVLFRRHNELSQASFSSSFDEMGKVYIDSKEMMFQIADSEFDQFDNQYLEFRFMMKNYENDEYRELEVPIGPCELELISKF